MVVCVWIKMHLKFFLASDHKSFLHKKGVPGVFIHVMKTMKGLAERRGNCNIAILICRELNIYYSPDASTENIIS